MTAPKPVPTQADPGVEDLREALARAFCCATNVPPDEPRPFSFAMLEAGETRPAWEYFIPQANELLWGPLAPLRAAEAEAAGLRAERDAAVARAEHAETRANEEETAAALADGMKRAAESTLEARGQRIAALEAALEQVIKHADEGMKIPADHVAGRPQRSLVRIAFSLIAGAARTALARHPDAATPTDRTEVADGR